MKAGFGSQASLIRMRSHREKFMLVAAAGLALSLLVVTFVVISFKKGALARSDDRFDMSRVVTGPAVGMVTLLAPERTIAKGSSLAEAASSFKEVYWPRSEVPLDAVRDRAELTGFFAKDELKAGAPILRANLSTEPTHISLPVTPGMRAVSIDVDATSGLEGHALPGTRVDVILTSTSTETDENKLESQVIVQNARVLSTNGDVTSVERRSQVEKVAAVTAKTITLEVSVQDALKIQTARQMGRLSLIMRATDDVKPVDKPSVMSNEIKETEAPRKPAKPGCVNRGKMRMGGQEYIINCEGEIVRVDSQNEP